MSDLTKSTPERRTLLEVDQIEVRYGAIAALKGISFTVGDGRDRRAARRERRRQDDHAEDRVGHDAPGLRHRSPSTASASTASRRTI